MQDGMRGYRAKRRRAALFGTGLCGLLGAAGLWNAALAQEEPNPLLTFGLSSSLNVSDNYDLSVKKPGTTTLLDNGLRFNYASQTQTQRLSFGGSGVLRLARLPNDENDARFDNQVLSAAYGIDGVNSAVTLQARYTRSELAFFDPLSLLDDEPLDENDLSDDNDGIRETQSAGFTIRTGLSSPLGFTLSGNTFRRNYIDTNDLSLYDTQSNSLSGSVGLRVTPVTQVSVTGSISTYDADNSTQTDRLSRSLSFGLSHDLARALNISASLGYQRTDKDETLAPGTIVTTVDDGLVGSLGLLQQLPNGNVGLDASHAITATGGRSTLRASREIGLPDGKLNASIGASKGDGGETSLIGGLAYTYELELTTITASLSRSVATSSDDEDLEVTRARIGWDRDITPVSGIGLSADYASTQGIGNDIDRSRAQVRASYRHALTEDWDLSGGYTHTLSTREDRPDADKNTVFLTIGREFRVRP